MRRFSWLFGVLGVILLITFGVYAAFVDKIDTPWMVVGGVGLAALAGWIALDWESLSRSAAGRGARYTWMALGLVAVMFAILVAANVLGYRHDQRWDITTAQRFQISEQTIKVLTGLDREITVQAFFAGGSPEEKAFKDLMVGYQEHTTLLKVEHLDPLRDPVVARQNEITSAYGTVVLKTKSPEGLEVKQRLDSEFKEEAITNALIRLTSGKEHVLCFTAGHEELDPDDDGSGSGMGGIVTKMEGQNYKAKKVTLATEGKVPADCEVLIAAGPRQEWLAGEREMAAAYVAGGGKFVALLDVLDTPLLARDMARYGITVGDDLVIEPNADLQSAGGDPTYLFLDPSGFAPHPVTGDIKGGVLMHAVRSVSKGPEVTGVTVTELAHTSAQAWGESTLDGTTQPAPDGADKLGPVSVFAVAEVNDPAALAVGATTLGAVGELQSPLPGGAVPTAVTGAPPADLVRKAGGKVVVAGDAELTSNALIDQVSNQDVFPNTIAWLVGEEDQVSIRPNEAAAGKLSMDLVQMLLSVLICLLFVPGATIVGAIATWRIRRQL